MSYPPSAYGKLFAHIADELTVFDRPRDKPKPAVEIDFDGPMPPMSRLQRLQRLGRMTQPAKPDAVVTDYHIANFERRAKGLGLLPGVFARYAGGCTLDGSCRIYANEHVEWLFRQYMKQVPV